MHLIGLIKENTIMRLINSTSSSFGRTALMALLLMSGCESGDECAGQSIFIFDSDNNSAVYHLNEMAFYFTSRDAADSGQSTEFGSSISKCNVGSRCFGFPLDVYIPSNKYPLPSTEAYCTFLVPSGSYDKIVSCNSHGRSSKFYFRKDRIISYSVDVPEQPEKLYHVRGKCGMPLQQGTGTVASDPQR